MRISGLGDINTVANAIVTQENMALNYPTLNNPGALMYAGQPGAVQGPGGFAQFSTYDAGYQALLNQINLDASRGQTISQFTSIYAPAGVPGNNPDIYAQNIANAAGVSPSDLLSTAIAGGSSIDPSTGLPADASAIDPTTMTLLAVGGALLLAWALG